MLVVRGYDDNAFTITSFLEFSYRLAFEHKSKRLRKRVSLGTTEHGKCTKPTNPKYLCLIS